MTPESNSILIACIVPRAVYESMLAAGLKLAVIGPQPGIASETVGVECSPELAAWCRDRAQMLLTLADTIETALRLGAKNP